MEIKNKLTVTRGEVVRGQWEKEGKGSSQGTCIMDPWTRTTWQGGLNVEGLGSAVKSNGRKMGTTIKKFKKKKYKIKK